MKVDTTEVVLFADCVLPMTVVLSVLTAWVVAVSEVVVDSRPTIRPF